MSEYKIEIPKLDRTSYQCPCSPFVKGIGACACDNVELETKSAGNDSYIVFNVEPKKFLMKTKFGITEFSFKGRTKSLSEMKLEHPPSYYGMKKYK